MSLLGELMGPVAAVMCVCGVRNWSVLQIGYSHCLVQTVGGRLEAKTCGRFASYSGTNLDVSETRLAFFFGFYSIDTWNCSCYKQTYVVYSKALRVPTVCCKQEQFVCLQ
jgi:hypothetical protein